MRHLSRLGFALWLGVFALFAGGVEQDQLASNVLEATLAEASGHPIGHIMPDGTFMAGDMHHAGDAGGHTHKGHMDCAVCGVVGAMAGLSLPILAVLPPRTVFSETPAPTVAAFVLPSAPHAPYASRAPPSLLI